MADFKWKEITEAINSLGEGRSTLTADQVKRNGRTYNLKVKLQL